MASLQSSENNGGFKIRLRKNNAENDFNLNNNNNNNFEKVKTIKTETETENHLNILSSNRISGDLILTNIANRLNIPEKILCTPKRTFGNSSKTLKTEEESFPADESDFQVKCEPLTGTNKMSINMNNISYSYQNESMQCYLQNQSDSINNQSTYYSRLYDLERFEIKRRLELIKSKPELISKFTTFPPETEEEYSDCEVECQPNENNLTELTNDDSKMNDQEPTSSTNNNPNKFIRAFSANESVVEVTKDTFEPKFVKDINFEVLKHPNSQQKYDVRDIVIENSEETDLKSTTKKKMKQNNSKSSSLKKKSLKEQSSGKVNLKKYPPKDNRLVPLKLEEKFSQMEINNSQQQSKESSSQSHSVDCLNNVKKSVVKPTTCSNSNNQNNNIDSLKSISSKSMPSDLNKIESNSKQKEVQVKVSNNKLKEAKSTLEIPNNLDKLKKLASKKLTMKANINNGDNKNENSQATSSKSKSSSEVGNTGGQSKIKQITVNKIAYQVLNKIGRGGSSVVYQVYQANSQKTLALKRVDLHNADETIVEGFRSEIKLLKSLSHCDRVVKMYDYEFRNNNKELLIVMEKGDADLSQVLKCHSQNNNQVSPHLIKLYWQEMLEAVDQIHQNHVVHSDLKPVNFILVSGKLKLIDFGIANTIQSNQTNVYKDTIIGTVDYMAPEAIYKRREHNNKVKYNQKVDIWSLGIILFNLVYGFTPFSHLKDIFKKGLAIVNGDIEYKSINDQLLLDVIKKCLQKEPNKRPTAADLLNHPYLTESSKPSNSVGTISTPNNDKKSSTKEDNCASNLPPELLDQMSNLTPNRLKAVVELLGVLKK